MRVITRFPPSPTGYFHIGSARTALFNYLFTHHEDGTMYLRFEDTDRERSKPEYEEDIRQSLAWLGFDYSLPATPRQSERSDVYRKYFSALLERDLAYEAEPSETDPDKKVVRFRNPNTKVTFTDLVRGEVTADTTDLGDFVIARSIDEPLYHLAVVIDDHEMGVTHVIRGEDHISNTPRQILILEALGFKRPIYAHIPLILDSDRAKLSKRKHGEAVWLKHYRERGYLPEAFINFMALIGWNPGDNRELFTLEELVKEFSFEKVQKGGGVFNVEKLNWINKEYIKRLDEQTQFEGFRPFVPNTVSDELLRKLLRVLTDRVSYFGEAAELFEEGEFEYLFTEPTLAPEKLPWKGEGAPATKEYLTEVITRISGIDDADWSAASIKDAVWPYAESTGKGNVLWPTRMALTGKEKSADPFTVADLVGKETTIARLQRAVAAL